MIPGILELGAVPALRLGVAVDQTPRLRPGSLPRDLAHAAPTHASGAELTLEQECESIHYDVKDTSLPTA